MEAQEVLDGGRCVEDITFSRHHQHEAVQRLKQTNKKLYLELHAFFLTLLANSPHIYSL